MISVSRFVAQELSRLDLAPSRIRVIPNSVDSSGRFNRDKHLAGKAREMLGLPPASFVLVYPARFAPSKRHLVLLSALSELLRNGEKIHLVLAGETLTQPNYYDQVWKFANAHDLTGAVSAFPFVENMPALYAASDALVFPAEHEPFGLCILEAMAMGVPVIAANSGGIPEIVANGMTGLLTQPGDSKALAAAIAAVKNDQQMRCKLSSAATHYVKLRHSVADFIKSIANVYDQVLDNVHCPPLHANA